MQWLGDYKEDDTLHFLWSTNAADGASITRATDGEVRVYKDNGVSQTTTGVTDTEDFDGLTGVHACTIVLTDVFYVTGADYSVVLQGATIDGQTVNAVLAHFSIENRFMRGTDSANTTVPDAAGTAATLHGVTDGKIDTAQADIDIITGAQDNIINHLTDVKGTSFTKDTHSLTNILASAKKVFIRAGKP